MTTEGADWTPRSRVPRIAVLSGAQDLQSALWSYYDSLAAQDVRHSVGSGMSAMLDALHFLTYLSEIESELRATLAETAEEDTRLPQATAPSMHGTGGPVHTAAYAEEARRIADALTALIALIREDLAKALGPCDYEYADTVPRHDRSPCGVVRLTTPTIPRAPGQPNSPSITTRWGVSAARPLGEAHAA